MAFDVQTLTDAARCAECLSPNQKQNVLLYLLNGILENGSAGGGGLHNLLSLTHPDTVPGPPLRGSLIVGNATPDWEALPIGVANRVLRSNGVDATWSQLVLTTDVTGILPIANGGTNSSAALNNNRIMVSSGGAIVEAAALTNGQLLIGSTGASPVAAALTAGTNITIGTGAGSITINAVMPGGFTGFDSPTASVGLAVVNGVATTAMRSDAAPPLSQAIAPTWTSLHIFAPTTAPAIQINPFGAAAGNTSELRFRELAAGGTNYTGFKAADAMAASEIYVLPDAAPSANRFLRAGAVAAGVSTLSWAQISLTADVTGILPVANGGTGTGTVFTPGSVIFAGVTGAYAEDNANLFWDDANNRLGVGTSAPAASLELSSNAFPSNNALVITLGNDTSTNFPNIFYRRSRGTIALPTAVLANDRLGGFGFRGYGTTGYFTADNAVFRVFAAENFTNTEQGTYFTFESTPIGSITRLERMRIDTFSISMSPTGTAAGRTNELRFLELAANGTNYTGFKAPDSIAASEIYVFPNAAPAANRFLQAAAVAGGVSALSWAQVSLTADVTGILPVANGGSGTGTAFTQGSVIFAGAAGVYAQDNANFFWDNTNNFLGIGIAAPTTVLHLNGTSATSEILISGVVVSADYAFGNVVNTNVSSTGNHVYGWYNSPTLTPPNDKWSDNFALAGIIIAVAGRTMPQVNQLDVGTITKSGTGTITDCAGIYLQSQSAGTNNYGIYQTGTNSNYFSGAIGIGVITPLAKLHVTNSASATVCSIFKAAASQSANLTEWQSSAAIPFVVVDATGHVGIGQTSGFLALLNVLQTITATTAQYATISELDFTLSSGDIAESIGLSSTVRFRGTGGNISGAKGISGLAGNAFYYNTGIADFVQGFFNDVRNLGTGTITHLSAVRCAVILNSGGGAITNAYGVKAEDQNAGTNNFGVHSNVTAGATSWNFYAATNAKNYFGGATGIAVTSPTAYLHIAAGTASINSAPLKFTTGTSNATAEAGAMEFTTDDLFFTITTGAARKRLLMADATAGLTSGKIPIATTNGRLVDLTASAAYTPTNVTTDRSYDADTVLIAELADVVGTMIADLQAKGILG